MEKGCLQQAERHPHPLGIAGLRPLQALYRTLGPTRFVKGCNMAFWRDDAICVNGYNELIQGWGSEDYEFGSRLWHIGVQHFSLKLSGIVYHIYHNVRTRDQAVANQVLANLTRSRRLLRCKQGISQYLYPDPETTTLVREVQE